MAWNIVSNLPLGPTGYSSYIEWPMKNPITPWWKYGLVGESQPHCGAMPFRNNNPTGINSKRCLRGEDWGFIKSVQHISNVLPDIWLWNFNRPDSNILHQNLDKQDIQNAYDWIKAWEQQVAWGSSFSRIATPDITRPYTEIQARAQNNFVPPCGWPVSTPNWHYDLLKGTIQNPLVVTMDDPSTYNNLRLDNMEKMFADYKKLRCTVTGFVPNATIYEYEDDGTQTGENNQTLRGISTRTWQNAFPSDQLIRATGNLYMFCTIYHNCTDRHGDSQVKFSHDVLFRMDGNTRINFDMFNRQNNNGNYFYDLDNSPQGRITGRQILQYVAPSITAIAMRAGAEPPSFWEEPPPLDAGYEQANRYAYTSVKLREVYFQIEQHWLVDY